MLNLISSHLFARLGFIPHSVEEVWVCANTHSAGYSGGTADCQRRHLLSYQSHASSQLQPPQVRSLSAPFGYGINGGKTEKVTAVTPRGKEHSTSNGCQCTRWYAGPVQECSHFSKTLLIYQVRRSDHSQCQARIGLRSNLILPLGR